VTAKTTVLIATAALAAAATVACAPPSQTGLPVVSRVVDGDTVEMSTGQTIRVIGVDTPEVGQPCYAEAAAALRAAVQGQPVRLTPGARDDVDRYGRLLRYVDTAGGVDAGLQMINQGWAIARYDSRDGYGRHTREASYVAADAASPAQTCGSVPPPPPPGTYYTNCTAVRAAGAAPLYSWQPGYRPALDGDGDGVACE
jgi:endonuclease YncB( thermonuclease family)